MVLHDIHATVIIEIAAGAAATDLGRGHAGAGLVGDIAEASAAQVAILDLPLPGCAAQPTTVQALSGLAPTAYQGIRRMARAIGLARQALRRVDGGAPLPGACWMSSESVQAVAGSDGAPVIDSAAASESGDVEERGRVRNQRQHRAVRRCHPQSASSLAAWVEQVMTAALRDCGRNDRQYRTSARVRNLPGVVGNHPRLAARVLGAEWREKSGKGVSAGWRKS